MIFNEGTIVQLRSGGPNMTVTKSDEDSVEVIYYNTYSGIYMSESFKPATLVVASTRPRIPDDAQTLRGTSVASPIPAHEHAVQGSTFKEEGGVFKSSLLD